MFPTWPTVISRLIMSTTNRSLYRWWVHGSKTRKWKEETRLGHEESIHIPRFQPCPVSQVELSWVLFLLPSTNTRRLWSMEKSEAETYFAEQTSIHMWVCDCVYNNANMWLGCPRTKHDRWLWTKKTFWLVRRKGTSFQLRWGPLKLIALWNNWTPLEKKRETATAILKFGLEMVEI